MPIETTPYRRLSEAAITPNATAGLTATAFAPLTKNTILSAAQVRALIGARCCHPVGGRTRVNIAVVGSRNTGASANNDTGSVNIWSLVPTADHAGGLTGGCIARHLGLLTFTIGSLAGVSGDGCVSDTEYFADTLVFTPSDDSTSTIKGPAANLQTSDSEGTNGVYSAAQNDVAELLLRAIGRASFLCFDFFNPSNAANRCNLLLQTVNV